MDLRDIKDAKVTHAGILQHNADGTTDLQKITQAGLVARSPEGTAAKGMNIRGNEDLWVEIQANTFRNWVNEHLRDANMQVNQNLNLFFLQSPKLLYFDLIFFVFSFLCIRFRIGQQIFVMEHIFVR